MRGVAYLFDWLGVLYPLGIVHGLDLLIHRALECLTVLAVGLEQLLARNVHFICAPIAAALLRSHYFISL